MATAGFAVAALLASSGSLASAQDDAEQPTSTVSRTEQPGGEQAGASFQSMAIGQARKALGRPAEDVAAELERVRAYQRLGVPGAESSTAAARRGAAAIADAVTDGRLLEGDLNDVRLLVTAADVQLLPTETRSIPAASSGTAVGTARVGGSRVLDIENTPNRSNADYGGGSCGNTFRDGGRGRIGLCWWKYRAWDESTSTDFWMYMGAVTGEPASYRLRPDPYIRYLNTASYMTSSQRASVGFREFDDHDPLVDRTGGCTEVPVSVSMAYRGANAGITLPVRFCDEWNQYVNGSTSYKRNRFDTGVIGTGGASYEVAHASLSETAQRPYSSYFPAWVDEWWGTFCYGVHTNCEQY